MVKYVPILCISAPAQTTIQLDTTIMANIGRLLSFFCLHHPFTKPSKLQSTFMTLNLPDTTSA
jgi:hypothetical protein